MQHVLRFGHGGEDNFIMSENKECFKRVRVCLCPSKSDRLCPLKSDRCCPFIFKGRLACSEETSDDLRRFYKAE